MKKRYFIQDYSEYILVACSDGLRIASKIMSPTFRSITQSNNAQSAQSAEGKGEQSSNAKVGTNSVLRKRNKRLERQLQLT